MPESSAIAMLEGGSFDTVIASPTPLVNFTLYNLPHSESFLVDSSYDM